MRSKFRLSISSLFIVSGAWLGGCVDPTFSIITPTENQTVASPVAARVEWGAGSPLAPGARPTVIIDKGTGHDIDVSGSFTVYTALAFDAATGLLSLPIGTHTMTVSGALCTQSPCDNPPTNYTNTSSTRNFQVVPAGFTLSASPSNVFLYQGQSATIGVSIARTTGSGAVTVHVTSSLPTGITIPDVVIGPSETSGVLTLSAASNGVTGGNMVTIGATIASDPNVMVPAMFSVDVRYLPTWSYLYSTYLGPNTAGHCQNCHVSGGIGARVFDAGSDSASFYNGMTTSRPQLLDLSSPATSLLGNTSSSPLSWVNPAGDMPFQATGSNDRGRDDIIAWLRAGAPNN